MEMKFGRVYKRDCGICGNVRLCHSLIEDGVIHGYLCKFCKNKLMLLTDAERRELYDYSVKVGFVIQTEDGFKKTIKSLKGHIARLRNLLDEYKADFLIERNKVTLLEAKIVCLERLTKNKRNFKYLNKKKPK